MGAVVAHRGVAALVEVVTEAAKSRVGPVPYNGGLIEHRENALTTYYMGGYKLTSHKPKGLVPLSSIQVPATMV